MNHDSIITNSKANKKYEKIKIDKFKVLEINRIPKHIIDSLKKVEDITCELSDALDRLGYQIGKSIIPSNVLFPLKNNYRVIGTAITQRSCPEQVKQYQNNVDQESLMSTRDVSYYANPGDVWVIDAHGCDCSHFGEIAAKIMLENQLSGTIIDGYIRDGETIKKSDYPFWIRGQIPFSGMRRIETVEINGAITLNDIQVRAGDLIAADSNGICVVPHAHVEEVYENMVELKICKPIEVD